MRETLAVLRTKLEAIGLASGTALLRRHAAEAALRALLLLLVLGGCAGAVDGPPATIATLDVPEILATCPKGADAPAPPAAPRTVEQVVEWARAVSDARGRTEKARAECAYRLKKLNDWVAANQVVPGNIPLTTD